MKSQILNKERYRYFSIDSLKGVITSKAGETSLFLNGKRFEDCNIVLSEGRNILEMIYPKNAFGSVSLSVSLPRNQKSDLIVCHTVSNGTGGSIMLDVKMGDNSALSVVDVTETHGYLKSEFHYSISSGCNLDVTTLDISNRMLSRDQIFDINAEGACVNVKGLFLSAKDEMVDNYIKMNHNAPRSESSQDVRGISSGLVSFLGHIYIAKDSQQSVAMQQSKNVVVGKNAHIYARPWLEIYADDVKCNHGATVGTSDEEALFYLCQRGIPKNMAKALLLEGFVSSILSSVPTLKKKVKSKLYNI